MRTDLVNLCFFLSSRFSNLTASASKQSCSNAWVRCAAAGSGRGRSKLVVWATAAATHGALRKVAADPVGPLVDVAAASRVVIARHLKRDPRAREALADRVYAPAKD
jgi:hypothetical protein